MWFVIELMDVFPLFSNNIAILLSWYIILSAILYLCDSRKYFVHRICGMSSPAPTTLLSVELRVLIFFFFNMLMIEPWPIDIVALVWTFTSLWAVNDAPTHHLTTFIKSILNISFIWIFLSRYTSTWTSFPQQSSSGYFTLVARNAIVVWIFLRHLAIANISCATEWWNAIFRIPRNIFLVLPSWNLNRFSVAGVETAPFISSENLLIIILGYSSINTLTSPFDEKSNHIKR